MVIDGLDMFRWFYMVICAYIYIYMVMYIYIYIHMIIDGYRWSYGSLWVNCVWLYHDNDHLVRIQTTMENQRYEWGNQLF